MYNDCSVNSCNTGAITKYCRKQYVCPATSLIRVNGHTRLLFPNTSTLPLTLPISPYHSLLGVEGSGRKDE